MSVSLLVGVEVICCQGNVTFRRRRRTRATLDRPRARTIVVPATRQNARRSTMYRRHGQRVLVRRLGYRRTSGQRRRPRHSSGRLPISGRELVAVCRVEPRQQLGERIQHVPSYFVPHRRLGPTTWAFGRVDDVGGGTSTRSLRRHERVSSRPRRLIDGRVAADSGGGAATAPVAVHLMALGR